MRKILRRLPLLACGVVALGQSGLFTAGGSFPVSAYYRSGYASSTMVVADFNRDGNADIARADSLQGTVTVYLGDGQGNFTPAPGAQIQAADKIVSAIAVGDFNGDGNPDLVVNGVSNTQVFLGDGTGGFSPGAGPPPNVHSGSPLLIAADFNRDGKVDAMSVGSGTSFVMFGDGMGGLAAPVDTFLGSYGIDDVAAADFNGDGKLDLAVGDSQGVGQLEVHLGDSTGRFVQGLPYSLVPSPYTANPIVAAGDFTGSGIAGVLGFEIFGGARTSVWSWNPNAANSPAPFTQVVTPVSPSFVPQSLAIGDFNGDGKLDWAGGDGSSSVEAYLGDGAGRFVPAAGSPFSLSGTPTVLATGDFNNDGKPDLAVDTGSSVVILLNTGATGPQPQTIQFVALSNVKYSTPPFQIGATSSSTLPVVFTSDTTSVCTVSGATVTLLSVGTCSITASQPGNQLFSAAPPVTQSFTVLQATQSITFAQLGAIAVGSPPIPLGATASSGLAVTYAAQPSLVCTVSGSTLTLVGTGSCSVTASQSGNVNYAAAAPVIVTFSVYLTGQTPQVITFPNPQTGMLGQTLSLYASANSNLPVTYTSNTPAVCTVSGGYATLVAIGNCSITASQPGNTTYAAAAPVTQTFTVTLEAQTIFWPTLPAQQTVGGTFALTASANSFLAVTYTSNTPPVCTVSGNKVDLIASGTCSITASQSGNSKYAAAQPVTQSFAVVSPSLQSQTVTFGALSGRTLGTASFTVSASASSGLAVIFISATPAVCTVSGNTVSLVSAGTCTITASQGGNATYNAAPPVSQSFTVAPPSLSQQTITFAPIASVALSAGTVMVSATASSGLPLTFSSSTPSICSAAGTTVTLFAAGTCTIVAIQPGNSAYQPASATLNFPVTAVAQIGPVISAVENAASYAPGMIAPASYAILYGANLAAQTGDTSVAVSITDAAGMQMAASIVYAGAGQVNIFAPADLALGSATVMLSNSLGTSAPFPITVANVAPGLFTVDTGATIPAAQVITTAADGSQIVQPVANCTASGCTLAPVVLTPGTPSYLVLYGTGIRGAGSLSAVSVTIGGTPATADYAGPQGGYPGLDQVNVLIPSTLAGQGQVSVQLSVFNADANPVQLLFR